MTKPYLPPELSIVIVTYQSAGVIGECLRSLMTAAQGVSCELLILDNASEDGTAELIRGEFPAVDLLVSDRNLGFARAVNLLSARARGEYLLLLNPDTIVREGAIRSLLRFASSHPEGGIYGGRTITRSGGPEPSSCWGAQSLWSLFCFATGLSTLFRRSALFDPESLGKWERDSVREVDIVTGCLAMIPLRLWREMGGFDESFWLYGEDADLSLRAQRLGYRPIITPDATVVHLVGGSSTATERAPLVLGARARLIRKHWPAWRARLGLGLLKTGCAVRAAFSKDRAPWLEAWRQRHQWGSPILPPRSR